MYLRCHSLNRSPSNRVFVAQLESRVHHPNTNTAHFEHLIVIPAGDGCDLYSLQIDRRQGRVYRVSHEWKTSQRSYLRQNSLATPIIRIGEARGQDGTNQFRRRILNTRHAARLHRVDGPWCCKQWVIEILRAELRFNTFPADRLIRVIDHLSR